MPALSVKEEINKNENATVKSFPGTAVELDELLMKKLLQHL